MKNEVLNSRDLKKKLKTIKESRKESNEDIDFDSRGGSKKGTTKPDNFKTNNITKAEINKTEDKNENLAELIFNKNHEIRNFLNSELAKVEDDLKKKFPDSKKENYFG